MTTSWLKMIWPCKTKAEPCKTTFVFFHMICKINCKDFIHIFLLQRHNLQSLVIWVISIDIEYLGGSSRTITTIVQSGLSDERSLCVLYINGSGKFG